MLLGEGLWRVQVLLKKSWNSFTIASALPVVKGGSTRALFKTIFNSHVEI